jgi:peroxiredoxin family protein
MEETEKAERATIVLHSGDMDKVYSALIIGNGALAMGMDVTIYFTFWGLQRLQKGALEKGPLSRLNLFGFGRWLIQQRMKTSKVASLRRLMADYKELGGKIIACEMTMEIMGIRREDLHEEWIDEYGAVGTYIQDARESKITLFI